MERVVKIQNEKLYELLKQKEEALIEGKAVYKEKEEVEKKLNKAGLKIQKFKDKIIPMVQKLTEKELGEFEDLVKVDIKDGEIILTIIDRVEEFKKTWKQAKYEKKTTGSDDDRGKS